ncbi:MAG: hypothetical protein ABI977_25790 [Acidobacteriota bacterium]
MNNDTQALPLPSVADVERISALADPVLRNLQITQCYHELSAVMAARMGLCANWCTFATWASKQAGQTIRKEDLKRTLESALGNSPLITAAVERVAIAAKHIGAAGDIGGIKRTIWEAIGPGAVIQRTSEAVARGNLKVFEEIGREFARFIAACLQDTTSDTEKLSQFCAELRLGEPPDGQDYLRQAFSHYYQALFETDAQRRAELQLLANLEIGFHEQTRLQPEIAESLDAALLSGEELRDRLLAAVFPAESLLVRLRRFVKRLWGRPTPLDLAINALIAEIRRHLHANITEHLMTLTVPRDVRLRLGADLQREFSASLKHLVLAELLALLVLIDPTPDSLRETGSEDWASLPERLHYIADLFRCFHESQELFDPPFTLDQVADMRAGRLPGGRL